MSAAATAAGYLLNAGKLRPSDQAESMQSVRCPLCPERIDAENLEFHLFLAHKGNAKG